MKIPKELMSLFSDAKKDMLDKKPGESDEDFRIRKERWKQQKSKAIPKSPYSNTAADNWIALGDE